MASVRIVVTGRVQRVGFRAFSATEARARQLTGEVRNRSDGSVEVVAHGSKMLIEDYMEVLRKGPRLALVAEMFVQWFEPAVVPGDFRITE
jgi:acylphosphatase